MCVCECVCECVSVCVCVCEEHVGAVQVDPQVWMFRNGLVTGPLCKHQYTNKVGFNPAVRRKR